MSGPLFISGPFIIYIRTVTVLILIMVILNWEIECPDDPDIDFNGPDIGSDGPDIDDDPDVLILNIQS